jgi:hypothetical protein
MKKNPPVPGIVKAIVRVINIALFPFGRKLNVFISRI